MNYEDELERSRARRSRKRDTVSSKTYESKKSTSGSHESWASHVEPGSRASRIQGASSGNHRRKKRGGKTKKIIIGVLIAIVVLIVAVVAGGYAYVQHHVGNANNQNPFDKNNVVNLELSQETREKMEEGYWTVAIFGLDSRDSSTGKGNQSDVIMIANLNRKTGEIKLVSVFRDTYLNVNDRNTYNKINAAYAEGGPEQAVKALNKNLDLNITHYAAFNWKAVATAINILGGVDIEISKSEFYYINAFITETVKGTGIGSTQLKSAGTHHMDGVQAVAYGRLRLMDSDYARTERQRIVIQKAFEKMKTSDLATLNSLVGNMCEMCATNIDINDLLPMVKDIKKFHMGDTMGFPAARKDQKIKIGSNNLACVIPQTLVSNVTSLHSFLFDEEDYTPTSTVQTISKKISDVSGLYNAGTEIDHVATDQGYVPKPTTAAATTAAETEREQSSEGESESSAVETGPDGKPLESESGSAASAEGESSSVSESGSLTYPGGLDPEPSTGHGGVIIPGGAGGPSGYYPTESSTSEEDRPKSPADMTKATTEAYGPGYEPTVPEATTSPERPYPGATEPSTQTSVVIISPTTAATPGPGDSPNAPTASSPSPTHAASPALTAPTAPAGATAPSSPADMTLPAGSSTGPASQTLSGPASGV